MLSNIAQWSELIQDLTFSRIVCTRLISMKCTVCRKHINRSWNNLITYTCLSWYCHQQELCLRNILYSIITFSFLVSIVNLHCLLLWRHPYIDIAWSLLPIWNIIKIITRLLLQEDMVIISKSCIKFSFSLLFSVVSNVIAMNTEAFFIYKTIITRHSSIIQWTLIELKRLKSILVRSRLSRSNFTILCIFKI